jgi:hypothetical protein
MKQTGGGGAWPRTGGDAVRAGSFRPLIHNPHTCAPKGRRVDNARRLALTSSKVYFECHLIRASLDVN